MPAVNEGTADPGLNIRKLFFGGGIGVFHRFGVLLHPGEVRANEIRRFVVAIGASVHKARVDHNGPTLVDMRMTFQVICDETEAYSALCLEQMDGTFRAHDKG